MSLALRSFQTLSFDEMLPYFYPERLLNLPYEKYEVGKYRREFFPNIRIVPYKNRELTEEFISRVYVGEVEEVLLILDLILQCILAEGRLMHHNDNYIFLWTKHQGEYILYYLENKRDEEVNRITLSSLEDVISFIFSLGDEDKVDKFLQVYPKEIYPNDRKILECIRKLNHKNVSKARNLIKEKGYYQFTTQPLYFSFPPFSQCVDGFVILTRVGFYLMGIDTEGHPNGAAFSLDDLNLILASLDYSYSIDENDYGIED